MRAYWEAHSNRWSRINFTEDPGGLGNVCHPDAPLWLNEYYARFQRQVYRALLSLVPEPGPDASALDVGCGAARWSTLLSERGYQTVGIDLQPELLEINRGRFPDIQFVQSSIQDFVTNRCFDLVSSVTVLQHIPFAEQEVAIKKLRALTKAGGYAIILENIADQGAHVFANSISVWKDHFTRSSFRIIATRRYDYSPLLRAISSLNRIRSWLRMDAGHQGPEQFVQRTGDRALHRIRDGLTRIATVIDSPVESILVASNVDVPAVHCGFLFEAV